MPARLGTRPLKAWRYIGVFGPELMICVAAVRIGRARQSFWAVWDREGRRLHERTWLSAGGVRLSPGQARRQRRSRGALRSRSRRVPASRPSAADGAGYAWTRKQGGIARHRHGGAGRRAPAAGRRRGDHRRHGRLLPRHTRWRWCAGVGAATDGRPLAWNLVDGVNDPPGRQRADGLGGRRAGRGAAGSDRPRAGGRRRPALRRRGHPRAHAEPARGAQPLSPAVRHLLRRAARRPPRWRPATA